MLNRYDNSEKDPLPERRQGIFFSVISVSDVMSVSGGCVPVRILCRDDMFLDELRVAF